MPQTQFIGLTDKALMHRFMITAGLPIVGEAADIIDELISRGYFYDERYRDFLTCEEWNRRYKDLHPRECS